MAPTCVATERSAPAVEVTPVLSGPLLAEKPLVQIGILLDTSGSMAAQGKMEAVQEAVAVPLIARGAVRFVLYGDNGADGGPVGPLDVLESAAARASRILERTLASRERKQGGASS